MEDVVEPVPPLEKEEAPSPEPSSPPKEEPPPSEKEEIPSESGNDTEVTTGKTYPMDESPPCEFQVPKTRFLLQNLWPIRHWSFAQKLVVAIGALHLIPIVLRWPSWYFILQFLLWRMAYNLGLGLMLHHQSKSLLCSRWMKGWMEKKGWMYALSKRLVNGNMEPDFVFEDYPADFNAWLVFRIVVDIILAMDVFTYGIAGLYYFEPPSWEDFGFKWFFLYSVGIVLFYLFYWAKSDAHRVIKDFAWYWGDFFFHQDQDLVFNGVFQFFPHPMYTVGYSFFYGTSLITRSYAVFYMSLAAHFSQLLFLGLVETPHIEKIYGKMVGDAVQRSNPELFHHERGYFRSDAIVFKNLDLARSSDLFLIVAMTYLVVLTFMDLPWVFYALQAIVWRVLHDVGLGIILKRQSDTSWWNVLFLKRGWSKKEAFEQWKRIFNVSLTMTHASFVSFCFNSVLPPASGKTLTIRVVLGAVLIGVNAWASLSTFEVLREFGWFYGDFFIDEMRPELYYNGIYRFLNNPESTLGFAAYYGLGLWTGNASVFVMAAFCHMLSLAFMRLVEGPHMDRLYGASARKEIPLTAHVKKEMSEAADSLMKAAEVLEEKVPEIRSMREELVAKAQGFLAEVKSRRNSWELKKKKE